MTARARYLVGNLGLAAVYFGLGTASLSLHTISKLGTLVWAPSAVGLAVLLLGGLRWWPGIAIGAVAVVFSRGFDAGPAFVIVANGFVEVAASYGLLHGVYDFHRDLRRACDVIALVLVCTVVSLITATTTASMLVAIGFIPLDRFAGAWAVWWWSRLSAYLIVTPAILMAAAARSVVNHHRPRRIEALVLGLTGGALVVALLGGWLEAGLPALDAPYLLLPLMLWAGLRFGPPGAAWMTAGTSVMVIVAQSFGLGPFARLADMTSFIAISSVSTLLLSALAQERIRAVQSAESAIRDAHAELQRKVDARTEDLQQANRLLERRDMLMRQAEELAHLGSFDYDLRTKSLKWSDELYKMYGRDPTTFEPTLEAFLGAILPEDRPLVQSRVEHAIAHGSRLSFEERIVRPDGTIRTLQTRARIETTDSGLPVRLAGCCQDITDRKSADAARSRLAQLVESSNEAIIGLSVLGVVSSWNTAATQLFGYSARDIVGRHASLLVPAEQIDHLNALLCNAGNGEKIARYELPHVRRDGSQFEASVTISPMVDVNGKISGICKVIRDVTSEKEAAAQLRASLREKEVLLREIHHRVKNNLQVIASLLSIQMSAESSAEAQKGLVESQNRIHSMALVHELLYRSKDLAHIELGDYLRLLTASLIISYNVSPDCVTVDVEAPGLALDIDRAIPCGLIVTELVSNALIHAYPNGGPGHVRVTLTTNHEVTLEVADDGVGIAPTVDVDTPGSFGLKIVRTLAHQLRGTLEILQEHGTRVRVRFPTALRDSVREREMQRWSI